MSDDSNPSISRAHAILRSLSAGPLGFNSLRRELGDPVPATLSRLLKALMYEQLVVQDDDGRYAVGPAMQALATALRPPDHRALIQAACESLADRTGQSALVCQRIDGPDGPQMVRRHRAQREGGMAYGQLDEPMFIMAMAFGWPLVASLPAPLRSRLVAEHARRSGEDADQTADELATLDETGVLVRAEVLGSHSAGCTRIVAPVGGDRSIGITVFGQPGRGLTKQQVATASAAVRQAAHTLSLALEPGHD